MTIDGKYYSEPELMAKFRQMQETIQRLEGENHKLAEKLEEIGTVFNEQVSLVGWHEEQEKEYKRLLKEAVTTMNNGSCTCNCYQCKWRESGCDYSFSFRWKHTEEVLELIGGEDG